MSTVRTCKTLASFPLLAGEKGLDKKIDKVMLLDDVRTGREFSLGSFIVGRWAGDNGKSDLVLLTKVFNSGAAGVAFQGNLPLELVRLSDEQGIPLFHISSDHVLLDVLFDLRNELVAEEKGLYSSFSPFADILLDDGDIERILWALRDAIKYGVAYRDMIQKKLFVASYSDEFKEHVKIYPLKEVMRLHEHVEVRVGGAVSGYLILNRSHQPKRELTIFERSAVENTLIAVKLAIEKKISAQKVERNYIDEFVRDLIYNKVQRMEELESRSRTFGWSPVNGVVAVTLEMITESGESGERELQVFFSTLRSKFLAFFPKSIYTLSTKSVVFLLSPPDPDSGAKTFQNNIVKVAEHLNEEAMRELRCQILVSVGGYKPDPLNTHESYREAIGAQRVAKLSSHAQNVVFWEFLGAMKLLSMISQNHEAALFCHNMLDKVIEHDSGCNGELLETLRVLSKCNWNIKHASEAMKFHYNTIKYRNKKINELLNFDPENSDHRFDIALALKLYDLGVF
ncbi:MAG: helix-turn-helix domain-containing protein [Aminobacterium colombiense]|uniref:helix-turn-helix domain-containing protein n=1 Tax=Aminobacterium sp. EBM-42 TaxID=1918503 RepID=UPI002580D754|nr:helix-turn-helix domain-containing protein [Aminobacterium sp. EBM-42]MDD3767948.1 helix-turn-helix domain-containing protein [Aminobacterium colombiense]MDD4265072.1 helix-turn-helix domain-containing protein [Aminobacterium colombiense]